MRCRRHCLIKQAEHHFCDGDDIETSVNLLREGCQKHMYLIAILKLMKTTCGWWTYPQVCPSWCWSSPLCDHRIHAGQWQGCRCAHSTWCWRHSWLIGFQSGETSWVSHARPLGRRRPDEMYLPYPLWQASKGWVEIEKNNTKVTSSWCWRQIKWSHTW